MEMSGAHQLMWGAGLSDMEAGWVILCGVIDVDPTRGTIYVDFV